ncbi:MerR family transcriptional regulator [Mycolicibacterium wolinskyi]|uniref:MerR family transcriptional regulator n=1 Tax=Mycolicibacterium TaxID=1866885 RepID=UPI000A1698A8|nr:MULTISPECIES: MerR family transcriptional regulator [Mycolicibacterium]MCV7287762.1 MerR family transcriptional regulator [Mycolicibacterium wolinskyi]MCV7294660.1 MerR family transcriptional regulator [Mycolicibacterium goodii]
MRIGELARRTGVTTRALRYYEEQGLLMSERSARGQRHYDYDAVERVRLIQQLYAAGLSSKVIAELTPCVIDGQATPALLDRLAGERNRIDELLTGLAATRDRLDTVISGATANLLTGQPCPAQLARRHTEPTGHQTGDSWPVRRGLGRW